MPPSCSQVRPWARFDIGVVLGSVFAWLRSRLLCCKACCVAGHVVPRIPFCHTGWARSQGTCLTLHEAGLGMRLRVVAGQPQVVFLWHMNSSYGIHPPMHAHMAYD